MFADLCDRSYNEQNQSPCKVANSLLGTCGGSPFPMLDGATAMYGGPGDDKSPCLCSLVEYNLLRVRLNLDHRSSKQADSEARSAHFVRTPHQDTSNRSKSGARTAEHLAKQNSQTQHQMERQSQSGRQREISMRPSGA